MLKFKYRLFYFLTEYPHARNVYHLISPIGRAPLLPIAIGACKVMLLRLSQLFSLLQNFPHHHLIFFTDGGQVNAFV